MSRAKDARREMNPLNAGACQISSMGRASSYRNYKTRWPTPEACRVHVSRLPRKSSPGRDFSIAADHPTAAPVEVREPTYPVTLKVR
jgi:hypothetical protein